MSEKELIDEAWTAPTFADLEGAIRERGGWSDLMAMLLWWQAWAEWNHERRKAAMEWVRKPSWP